MSTENILLIFFSLDVYSKFLTWPKNIYVHWIRWWYWTSGESNTNLKIVQKSTSTNWTHQKKQRHFLYFTDSIYMNRVKDYFVMTKWFLMNCRPNSDTSLKTRKESHSMNFSRFQRLSLQEKERTLHYFFFPSLA